MRKLIYVFIFTILLCSCSNDKEVNFTLSNKKYVYSPYTVQDGGQYLFYIYYFISNSTVEKQVRRGSSTGSLFTSIKTCTYELNYPKLTINDGGTFTYTFVTESTFRSDFNSTEYNIEK